MKMVLKLSAFFFCILCFNTTVSHAASAPTPEEQKDQNELKKGKWKNFESVTGIFTTKFPVQYKYKVYPFQFNEHSVAFSTEIVSSLDGHLQTGSNEKSILIKAQQTFGPELTIQETHKILKQEARKYRLAARSMSGEILSDEDFVHEGGFLGKKFYISYKSKEGETYGLRIQVIMTNYAKVEQVLSGPANSIYSFRSNDFLESIKLNDGRFIEKDPKNAIARGTGWLPYTSRNKLFTVKLPPLNRDYAPNPPTFSSSKTRDTMEFEIVDPVRSKSVFYNVSAYKLDKAVNITRAKNFIISKHVSNFVANANPNNLLLDHYKNGNVSTVKTKLVITPTKRYPLISNIYIEARYINNFLVVQEFLTTRTHSKTEMQNTFFSLLDFHPQKYKPMKTMQKKAPAK